ncbi:MAG: LuxR family transcriptional regulator, partial [Chloroflexi bacterium]|nr:LuxR family transcriptional regulator [Chloroflexota bacterium]
KPVHDRAIGEARERLGDAAFERAWAAGLHLARGEAMALALQAEVTPSAGPSVRSSGPLSPREREVAALIAHGLTSAEIAERLVITPRTADTHADNIRTKLGLRSRTEIASWATARGLTSSDPQPS